MNRRIRKIPTKFGDNVRFEVPVPPKASREDEWNVLEEFKSGYIKPVLDEADTGLERTVILNAAKEAMALASRTSFPMLVFPLLFEERARYAWATYNGLNCACSQKPEIRR
ncbi:MAG: hypothetical protein K9N52_05855, partial [Verrucomicrobia bacterium]|nr:hypothetical protein [Verrucomicrobiota bacterium]